MFEVRVVIVYKPIALVTDEAEEVIGRLWNAIKIFLIRPESIAN